MSDSDISRFFAIFKILSRRREEARRLRAEAAKEWEEAKGRFERG